MKPHSSAMNLNKLASNSDSSEKYPVISQAPISRGKTMFRRKDTIRTNNVSKAALGSHPSHDSSELASHMNLHSVFSKATAKPEALNVKIEEEREIGTSQIEIQFSGMSESPHGTHDSSKTRSLQRDQSRQNLGIVEQQKTQTEQQDLLAPSKSKTQHFQESSIVELSDIQVTPAPSHTSNRQSFWPVADESRYQEEDSQMQLVGDFHENPVGVITPSTSKDKRMVLRHQNTTVNPKGGKSQVIKKKKRTLPLRHHSSDSEEDNWSMQVGLKNQATPNPAPSSLKDAPPAVAELDQRVSEKVLLLEKTPTTTGPYTSHKERPVFKKLLEHSIVEEDCMIYGIWSIAYSLFLHAVCFYYSFASVSILEDSAEISEIANRDRKFFWVILTDMVMQALSEYRDSDGVLQWDSKRSLVVYLQTKFPFHLPALLPWATILDNTSNRQTIAWLLWTKIILLIEFWDFPKRVNSLIEHSEFHASFSFNPEPFAHHPLDQFHPAHMPRRPEPSCRLFGIAVATFYLMRFLIFLAALSGQNQFFGTDFDGDLSIPSLYLLSSTITTVGLGDLHPQTETEAGVFCLILLLGALIASFLMTKVISRLTDKVPYLKTADFRKKQRVTKLDSYLKSLVPALPQMVAGEEYKVIHKLLCGDDAWYSLGIVCSIYKQPLPVQTLKRLMRVSSSLQGIKEDALMKILALMQVREFEENELLPESGVFISPRAGIEVGFPIHIDYLPGEDPMLMRESQLSGWSSYLRILKKQKMKISAKESEDTQVFIDYFPVTVPAGEIAIGLYEAIWHHNFQEIKYRIGSTRGPTHLFFIEEVPFRRVVDMTSKADCLYSGMALDCLASFYQKIQIPLKKEKINLYEHQKFKRKMDFRRRSSVFQSLSSIRYELKEELKMAQQIYLTQELPVDLLMPASKEPIKEERSEIKEVDFQKSEKSIEESGSFSFSNNSASGRFKSTPIRKSKQNKTPSPVRNLDPVFDIFQTSKKSVFSWLFTKEESSRDIKKEIDRQLTFLKEFSFGVLEAYHKVQHAYNQLCEEKFQEKDLEIRSRADSFNFEARSSLLDDQAQQQLEQQQQQIGMLLREMEDIQAENLYLNEKNQELQGKLARISNDYQELTNELVNADSERLKQLHTFHAMRGTPAMRRESSEIGQVHEPSIESEELDNVDAINYGESLSPNKKSKTTTRFSGQYIPHIKNQATMAMQSMAHSNSQSIMPFARQHTNYMSSEQYQLQQVKSSVTGDILGSPPQKKMGVPLSWHHQSDSYQESLPVDGQPHIPSPENDGIIEEAEALLNEGHRPQRSESPKIMSKNVFLQEAEDAVDKVIEDFQQEDLLKQKIDDQVSHLVQKGEGEEDEGAEFINTGQHFALNENSIQLMSDRNIQSQFSDGRQDTSDLLEFQHQINQESLSMEMESVYSMEGTLDNHKAGSAREFNPMSQMGEDDRAEIVSGGAIEEIGQEENEFPLFTTRTIKGTPWHRRPALEVSEDATP